MAKITIWGARTPRSLRPLWMAEELALDYQHRPIAPRSGETQTPEYTHLNPKQKIPLLVDADITLTESVAICRLPSGSLSGARGLSPQHRLGQGKGG